MIRLPLTLLAIVLTAPTALAQLHLPPQDPLQRQLPQLPPPLPPQELQQQPLPGEGPQLQAPRQAGNAAVPNGAALPNNAADQPKRAGKGPEFFKARRELLAARKQAQKDRMHQFKADRAAAEEKAYLEWHERYLADAPVRQEIVRAEAALARDRFAYTYAQPIFIPVYPVYAPIFPIGCHPIYGQFWCW
jgi:hypothetical protein